jgi:hypothetical protein
MRSGKRFFFASIEKIGGKSRTPPSFNMIPANIIETAIGAST